MHIFHAMVFHILIDLTHARVTIELEVGLSAARLQCSEAKAWGRV